MRSKSPELRAEVSKECCPNSPGRNHRVLTSPVSTLTARLDPRWTVVVDARVLRIDDINISSTTGNNVGFRPVTPDRSRNKFSRSEQRRLCFVGLTFAFLKQSWLRREHKPTTCYSILTTVCITIECRTINHSDARF